MKEETVEQLKKEISEEMFWKDVQIQNVEIDEVNHFVDFSTGSGCRYYASLHKNNKHIKKNSIRRSI